MKTITTNRVLIALLITMCVACETETEPSTESIKNIEGSWKIVSVTRNEVDITDAIDFSQFKINFNADNTYSFDNYLPFIVKQKGSWALDDPQYPLKLNFREDTNPEQVVTDLTYPVVQGKRQIRLTFSPGCKANEYKYVLERVTE
jgi:hypothetical protein